MRSYLATVPSRYKGTDVNHSTFNKVLHKAVSLWEPETARPFLLIQGETGESKTRCSYLRGRDFASEGRNTVFIRATDFVQSVQYRFGESGAKHTEIIRDATKAAVLIFDDLGKATPSPAVVAALFKLIDERHSRNFPTILTMNCTISETTANYPKEYRDPIGGRLLDSSTIIEL